MQIPRKCSRIAGKNYNFELNFKKPIHLPVDNKLILKQKYKKLLLFYG